MGNYILFLICCSLKLSILTLSFVLNSRKPYMMLSSKFSLVNSISQPLKCSYLYKANRIAAVTAKLSFGGASVISVLLSYLRCGLVSRVVARADAIITRFDSSAKIKPKGYLGYFHNINFNDGDNINFNDGDNVFKGHYFTPLSGLFECLCPINSPFPKGSEGGSGSAVSAPKGLCLLFLYSSIYHTFT